MVDAEPLPLGRREEITAAATPCYRGEIIVAEIIVAEAIVASRYRGEVAAVEASLREGERSLPLRHC